MSEIDFKEEEKAKSISDMRNILSAVNNSLENLDNTEDEPQYQQLTESVQVNSEPVAKPKLSTSGNKLIIGGLVIFEHSDKDIFNLIKEAIESNGGINPHISEIMSKAYKLDHIIKERKEAKKNFYYYKSTNEKALMNEEKSRYNKLNSRVKSITEDIANIKGVL